MLQRERQNQKGAGLRTDVTTQGAIRAHPQSLMSSPIMLGAKKRADFETGLELVEVAFTSQDALGCAAVTNIPRCQ